MRATTVPDVIESLCLLNRYKNQKIALVIVLFLALSACTNSSMRDLEMYIDEVLARKGWPIDLIPQFPIPPTHMYQSSNARDPFQADQSVAEHEQKPDKVANSGVSPPDPRNREELERFPLDALRMVGTLEQGLEVWGIILGPDGTVYRVQKGNYIGRNYGKIHGILMDRIELTEVVLDGQGSWQEREAALALAE